jgi:FMN phosphatase YigB (HAD superfamily)
MTRQQGEIPFEFRLRSEIRVVTFDLDNTLWNTAGCIDAANNALAAHLDADNILQPKRVEKIMGELFKTSKSRYCPLDAENAKAPVLLTKLRTDAISQVLEDHNGYSPDDALSYAEKAFQVWTNARHDAIPENFAAHVLTCLEKVSSIKTSGGHKVLIGAITDGNSDPRKVDVLRDYFDFCVNAEGIGVGKPDKRVYLEAIRHVVSHPSFQDLGVKDLESEEELENCVGPYWVHVGDDFVKDIVAAKSLNMRSIWVTELIRDKLQPPVDSKNVAVEKTRDVKDFVKEIAEKGVVEMTIGADSYLADSMTREFVDAVAEEFHHLSDILLDWHQDGSKSRKNGKSSDEPELAAALQDLEKISKNSKDVSTSSEDDFITVITPDKSAKGEVGVNGASKSITVEAAVSPRAFRLVREDCSMDVPAPLLDRETRTMKDVMSMAQMDKSSGVFSFQAQDVEALREGKLVLMVKIGDTDLQFSREIFVGMSVQEVLSLTDQNPVALSMYMKEAADSPSFDLF